MKIKFAYLLLCSFSVLTALAKDAIIKGKINGKLPETLYYTAPVNGALGFDIYYTAVVDAKGNFEIKADINDISFIDIFYNYLPAGFIVAQPGGQYNLTITETEGNVTPAITGTAAPLQQLYNRLVQGHRRGVSQAIAMQAVQIHDPHAFEEYFEKKYEAEVHDFSELKDNKTISNALFEAVMRERAYFYAASKSLAIYIKHVYADREDNPPSLAAFDALWPKVYEKYSADTPFIKQLPEAQWFLLGYEFYKMYEAAGFEGKKLDDKYDGMSAQQIREKRMAGMPGQNVEYYLASSLYSRVFEGQKDKDALEAYYDFKKFYPKSSYIKYLEPKMAAVAAFFSASESLPQGAAFVDDYAKVNTFEELVKKFPGKKLYFDVWATWCGPCREEFKYKDALYKLLKANDITIIYISVDKDDKDETWKKMIGHYNLQGFHVRTSQTFSTNLATLFHNGNKNDGGLLIPWYILVNADGTTAALHAAPPSELSKLEADIKKL